jgi:cell division protein FtsZ
VAAAEMAISSPLLEASIDGAHGVLLSIQGGSDLGLFEINEAAQLVSNSAAVDANIIFGAVIDDALGDEVRVTVIAAGLDAERTGRGAGRDGEVGGASAGAGGSSFNSSSFNSNGPSFDTGGPASLGTASLAPAAPAPAPAPPPAPATVPMPPPAPAARPFSPGPASTVTPDPEPGAGTAEPGTDSGDAPFAVLGAPVADDPFVPPPDPPAEPSPVTTSAMVHADVPAKTFDVAATRRRPVVFEEDDDLDVPDFLK